MSDWGYPKYVSVAAKKAKAEKKLKQLRKKMPDIRPVILEGSTLARTWWGKSWNGNLERYADYGNRIDRGKSYVRHGAVLDLRIAAGEVRALVLGSAATPYEVTVAIQPFQQTKWRELKTACEGQLRSLQDLLAGKFPKALAEILFDRDKGLFPSPRAITFACSCPDHASMCKHVAATLYGVGARFDEDPSLFFTLRGVDTGDLIAGAIQDRTEALLTRTKKKSAKVIDDADLAGLFGIDMDEKPDFAGRGAKPLKDRPAAGKAATKAATKAIKKTASPPAPARKPKPAATAPKTATGLVAALVAAAPSGVGLAELVKQTGFPKTKLYGIVHRLKQLGRIKNLSTGVYVKAWEDMKPCRP